MTCVHFFTKGAKSIPSSRYRAFAIADELNENDYSVSAECHPPKTGAAPVAIKSLGGCGIEIRELFSTRRQFSSVQSSDIIYCQRPIYKRLRALYLLSKHTDYTLVFDFDDAVFLNRPDMTRWFLERADLVVTGNRFLETYANHYCSRSVRIPTAIPYEAYREAEYDSNDDGSLRIGWVGNGAAHKENLIYLEDIISSIADDFDNLEIHLVGTRDVPKIEERFLSIEGLGTEFTRWIPSDKYHQKIPDIISSFDVGVMPLEDTMWNRGKSALKLLEYMATGVPSIASPVGENEHIIDDSRNGFLAADVESWHTALEKLTDPETRAWVSEAAEKTVVKEYTRPKVTQKLVAALDEIDNNE